MQPLFSSLNLDISTAVFLGKSTDLLSRSSVAGQRFAVAFDYAQRRLSGVEDYGLTSMAKNLVFGDVRLQSSLNDVYGFIDNVLIDSMQAIQNNAGQAGEKSFLQSMISQGRTREELKVDILNIVLAGKDTMATCLSSVWYMLSKNPLYICQIALRSCCSQRTGSHKRRSESLSYTEQCIQRRSVSALILLPSLMLIIIIFISSSPSVPPSRNQPAYSH